jgi:AcrR family transcriptional regulator
MVTRRKQIKERDSEQTKRELLDAVGKVIGEHGYAGLTTRKISAALGKDRNLIRYHFGSLEGLLEAYINDRDYWPPFFERFKLSADPQRPELEKLFSELMQENFRYFLKDPEMQQIILWQISQENELLKKISDTREREGAKLLGMTDQHFEGTGISFRSILALLLGGIYYVVLHGKANKSTVSGIDVNQLADQREMLKTIGQILEWTWRAAEKD